MSVYKRFALIFACFVYIGLPLCFLALCALLWIYDPFMFFHKPYFREQTYHSDMRIQARGIIDFTDFDSVILGSSTLENTSAKEASSKIGGKWVNLSMGGAHPYERAVILKYLLKHKKIKRILYSFDTHAMILDKPRIIPEIKTQLYSDDFSYKLLFYLNKKFIKCALSWSKSQECVGSTDKIPTEYYLVCQQEAGFLNWCHYDRVSKFLKQADKIYEPETFKGDIEKSKQLINKYILDFVRENPQTQFYFAISAYPTFYYRVALDYEYEPNPKQHLDKWSKILMWLVNEAQNLSNMKIYGFDDLELTNDTSNYIDEIHYRIGMPLNTIALDAIKDGTHILTPENIDEYLQTMENKIKAYDLAPLIQEVKEWEANSSKTKSDFTDP